MSAAVSVEFSSTLHNGKGATDTPLTSDFGGWERYDGATTTDGPGQSRQRLGTPDLAPTYMEVDMDSARQPGPDVPLIEMAAKVIVRAKAHEFSAPYHWAYALHQAGMLTQPGGCSQAPHAGVEFYGPTGGCAECGYRPPAPHRQCCASRVGQRHAWGCDAIAEATS